MEELRQREGSSSSDSRKATTASKGAQSSRNAGICVICSEIVENNVSSSCCPENSFCRKCVIEFMEAAPVENASHVLCPGCNSPFTIDLNAAAPADGAAEENEGDDDYSGKAANAKKRRKVGDTVNDSTGNLDDVPSLKELGHINGNSILRRIPLENFATSSKIEVLTSELLKMRQTSQGSKAIIFSQFVNFLDLVRWRLHSDPFLRDAGLGARTLQGSMKVQERDEVLREFREDSNVRVLLISLKAGGVALNLTNADHIFLCDPWWNPAAEMQAIDRTHRLGQRRAIKAIRLVCLNTVEERILQLQEKKRLVFDGTVGGDADALARLTVDDITQLFR